MKKLIFITLILFTWTLGAYAADLKIGYVDLNKALNESESGKKAKKILEDMINSKQTVIAKKEDEIKTLKEEFDKQSSVLTPEAAKEKQDQLNKLMREGQRMVNDFQEEIKKKETELTQEIQKDLIDIVNKLGKDEGYTIVFEKGTSGIVYSQKELDITEKIIKKYNESTSTKK